MGGVCFCNALKLLHFPLDSRIPSVIQCSSPQTNEGAIAMAATFELFKDDASEWRWSLRHENGNIIADSGEGYKSTDGAENGIESVKENAPDAPTKEL